MNQNAKNANAPCKTALVTGAAKRIGSAIAQALHADGYFVFIHCRHSGDAASALVCRLNAIRPQSACVLPADLGVIHCADDLDDFCAPVRDRGRLDVLVHNASSFYPTDFCASDWRADHGALLDAWEDLFLSNAKAPFFLTRALLPLLRQSRGNVVSVLDIHAEGKPFLGYPIYTMAKAAHRAMVHGLALELAPLVRVNGVAPGVNVFPENADRLDDRAQKALLQSVPLAKIGEPSDVAQAVLFMAKNAYITGQILAVDGGRSLTLAGG